jgi:hypothetical protein
LQIQLAVKLHPYIRMKKYKQLLVCFSSALLAAVFDFVPLVNH